MSDRLKKSKVVLGLSGGVDSTAAALLLLEQGYEVTGLYFDINPEDSPEKKRAELAAQQLGIGFIYKNVSDLFQSIVIDNFCSEYAAGRTPNPCIVCNPTVKFRTLLEAADEIGAYHIATGHYADTYYDESTKVWYISRATNEQKDQSYMLYRLGQEAILRLLLPLNKMDDKEQVRQLAREKALKNAEAKDSQEICFIDDNSNYKNFLEKRGIICSEGDFVDSEGNILGRHSGILNYTIGQRKGLGIALGKPVFVTEIDGENNRVVLGDNHELFSKEVVSGANILFGKDYISMAKEASCQVLHDCSVTAKIRYAAKPAEADLQLLEDGKIKTIFHDAQRAPTPGQSIVFYKNNLVIGGGFIL